MNIRKYQFGGFSRYYNLDNKDTRKVVNEGTKKFANAGLNVLGMVGDLFSSVFTGTPTTTTNPKTVSPEMALQLKQSILKGMTWLSPLNYGAAIATGHGLDAKKGEEQVAKWDPRLLLIGRLGELYVGPKAVRGVKATPRVVVNAAAKAGSKTAKKVIVARELSNGIKENTKSGKVEVSPEYFKAEDKWYRLSERPEKIGIEELGKNITTQDDPEIPGTIGNWRSTILDNRKGLNGKSKRIVPKPDNGFVLEEGMNFAKHGQAHGNTSQAAKGLIWDGTFAFSNRFPVGIIEGQAPNKIFRGMTAEGKDSRSNFVLLDWEDVPIGSRVGFHTGEMPMSNLGWFLRTNRGTYTYEPIIPEKRITVDVGRKYKLLGSLPRLLDSKTYPLYRGPRFSVNSVVNPNGTVNPRQAMTVLHTVADWFGNKAHRMEDRLENSKWHKNDPTTYDHTKLTAQSAWQLPTPFGFTKQDLMIAALGHDFGKMISGEGHAQIGADLARQVFPDLTDALYTAIAEHMGTPTTPLGLITKAADITNGRSFKYLLHFSPELYNKYLGNTAKTYNSTSFIKKSLPMLRIRSRLVTNGDDVWELNIKDWYNERVLSIPDEIKKDLKEDISLGLDDLFYKNGFTPKHKVNQGKFNEAFGLETVRRLQGFGIKPLSYISVYDGPSRVIHTVQGKVTQNAKTPSYMGYFLQEGAPGFYSPFWDVSVVDPTLKFSVPDLTFHERNMHGSESVLEAVEDIPRSVNDMSSEVLFNYGPGATPMKPYILFVNNLVYKKGSSDLLPEIKPLGNSFKYKYHLFTDGALDWKEARATIGQVIRNLYMKAKNGKSYTSIEDIRPEFEKLVDNISDSELGELLYKANGYGETYLQVGPKVNPNFYKELRALLKYAPGISPFIFGNNEKE